MNSRKDIAARGITISREKIRAPINLRRLKRPQIMVAS
jgi:hypothetical protein